MSPLDNLNRALHLGRRRATLALAKRAAAVPSRAWRRALVDALLEQDRMSVLESLAPRLNRTPTLDTAPVDLRPSHGFEHLAGLFASTSLNHGVIGMTFRQAAYVYGLAQEMGAKRAIEVGRFRGGTTLVLTSAMGPEGRLWSIDVGEKEERFRTGAELGRPFDEQIADRLQQLGLTAELLIGDSRTIEIETGEVDLVLIDGDHTYEGVKIDFERFGTRVRVGGAILFDDAFDDGFFPSHEDSVGRLVEEITADGSFRLVKAVNRLAHVERVK